MVWLIPIQQFEVQVAPGLVRESLEKLSSQAKTECRRHILTFFLRRQRSVSLRIQAPPNQERSSAKIDHATRQAFIHGHVRLAREWVSRIKTRAVSPNPRFVSQRLDNSLPQRNPAILHGVM